MKMSASTFNQLKADCKAVVAARSIDTSAMNSADAWAIFNFVWFERTYDDIHPSFTTNPDRVRVLDKIGDDDYRHLDLFYRTEDLNDDHIRTALKKIFPKAFAAS